jgi:hypothetical protein
MVIVTLPLWNWSVPALAGVQSPAASALIVPPAGTAPPLDLSWNDAVCAPLTLIAVVVLQELMANGAGVLRLDRCIAKWVDLPTVAGLGEAVREPFMVVVCVPTPGTVQVYPAEKLEALAGV